MRIDMTLNHSHFTSPVELALLAHIENIDLRLQYMYHQRFEKGWHEQMLLAPQELLERMNYLKGEPYWAGKEYSYKEIDFPFFSMLENEPLMLLMERFELTELEIQVIVLSILPHANPDYHKLFSVLQGEGQKLPTIGLALSLFSSSWSENKKMQSVFLPQSPLFAKGLLQHSDKAFEARLGWGSVPLIASPEVWHFLMGERFNSPEMNTYSRWISLLDESELTSAEDQLSLAVDKAFSGPATAIMLLQGATEHQVARVLRTRSHELLVVYADQMPAEDDDARRVFHNILLRVCLYQSGLLICSLPDIKEKRPELYRYFQKQLSKVTTPTFCLVDKSNVAPHFFGCVNIIFDMPSSTPSERDVMLKPWVEDLTESDRKFLSQCFTFTDDELPIIRQEANFYSQDNGRGNSYSGWHRALGYRMRQHFGNLARRIEPKRKLDDLIISADLHRQLQEISAAVKHRTDILERGFDKKINYGTGVSALFYGPSGTGKTMAAEVLAYTLQTDLIKIDLSAVVSKYIGETEKNLAKIFDLAEADAGVIFFDEADALFGKRSQVKDAKDKHANIEVSYLLQRLEDFPGLIVLATNHRNHIDEAFSRRFTFITRFSFPDAELREKMWHSIWPSGIALDSEIDFKALSKSVDVTGANIRNIALLSVCLSKLDGSEKVMAKHINLAVQRELAKVGRINFQMVN